MASEARRAGLSRRHWGGLFARAPLGVLSQGLSSASNLLFGISVARVATPAEYGSWAIGFGIYAAALNLTRATAGTPLMLSGDATKPAERDDVRGSMGSAFATGVIIGVAMLGSAWVALTLGGAELATSLAMFGVGLPLLLLNDLIRNAFFRDARPGWAVGMDLTWVAFQTSSVILLELTSLMSQVTGTLSWVAASIAATCAGWIGLRLLPSIHTTREFVRQQAGISGRLVIDSAITATTTYAVPIIVASVAGLAAAGNLRAGQTLMGGMSIFVLGLTPVLTLESRRALSRGASPVAIMLRWSVLLAVAAGVYGLAVLSIPDTVGRALVGASWEGATVLLLPLSLQLLARGPYTAVPVLLKSLGALRKLVSLRLQTAIPSLLMPSLGAVVDGARGAAWGLLVGTLLTNAQCIRTVRKLRPQEQSGVGAGQNSRGRTTGTTPADGV